MATSWITTLKAWIEFQPPISTTTASGELSLTKLVDLPLEILVEFLLLLEWKDILRIRRTCQLLRATSLARPVWASLVKHYSATVHPRPFLPEKPLDLYSDRELEHLVLRWRKGQAGYARTQPITTPRHLSMQEIYSNKVHLVEGGRWLLFGTRNGSVKYHDLNAFPNIAEPFTLITTLFSNDDKASIQLSIDMDPDAEYLTFNLGVMTSRLRKNPVDFPRFDCVCIHVSRVTSDVDDDGHVRGLRAERLACFREEDLWNCGSLTLRKNQVAYSVYTRYVQNIAIVDWTVTDSASLAYSRRLIYGILPEWLILLPYNGLLCYADGEILLFNLCDVSVATLLPTPHNLPSQPSIAQLVMRVDAISRPYFVHNSIRFSVMTEHGVKGLIIPYSNGGILRIMNCIDLLSDSSAHTAVSVGYDHAIVYWLQLKTLQYSWPEDNACSRRNTIRVPDNDWNAVVCFDEGTGRVVIAGHIQYVVDLAVK